MTPRYDPFDHEVMLDPWPVYAALRREKPVYYIEKYDCWALARFEDIWNASLDHEAFSAAEGTSPPQILLREPSPRTFLTMDLPEHRRHRALIAKRYTRPAMAALEPSVRELVRETLLPLLGRGTFDVYADLANRVATVVTAGLLGIDRDEALEFRSWIDGFFHRDPRQQGTNDGNLAHGERIAAYLGGLVERGRRTARDGDDHLSVWLRAEVDGARLSDEQVAGNIYAIMVTGSEVVPLAVANTVVFLHQHPEQRARVLDDPSLVPDAFAESLRYDQPTNLLGRRVTRDAEIGGEKLREGQGLLFLFASANRDESEFETADRFDIGRRPRRTLSYGHGIHKCLGEHMGRMLGRVMLEELLPRVADYEIEAGEARRIYGEFLSGYNEVPIRFEPARV